MSPLPLRATAGPYAGQDIYPFVFQEGSQVVLKARTSTNVLVNLSEVMEWSEIDISFTDVPLTEPDDSGYMGMGDVQHKLTNVPINLTTKISSPSSYVFKDNTKYNFNFSLPHPNITQVHFPLSYTYVNPPLVTILPGGITKLKNSIKFVLNTDDPTKISEVELIVYQSVPLKVYTKTLVLDWSNSIPGNTITVLFNGEDAANMIDTVTDYTVNFFTDNTVLECSAIARGNPDSSIVGSYSSNLAVTSPTFTVLWNDTQNAPVISSLTSTDTQFLLVQGYVTQIPNVPSITSYTVKLSSATDSKIYYNTFPYVSDIFTKDLSTLTNWKTDIGLLNSSTSPSFAYNNLYTVNMFALNGPAVKNISLISNPKSAFVCKINEVILSNTSGLSATIKFNAFNLVDVLNFSLDINGTTYENTYPPALTSNTLNVVLSTLNWSPALPPLKNDDICALTVQAKNNTNAALSYPTSSPPLTIANVSKLLALSISESRNLDVVARLTFNQIDVIQIIQYSLLVNEQTYTTSTGVPSGVVSSVSLASLTWTPVGSAPPLSFVKGDVCTLTVNAVNNGFSGNNLSVSFTIVAVASITDLSLTLIETNNTNNQDIRYQLGVSLDSSDATRIDYTLNVGSNSYTMFQSITSETYTNHEYPVKDLFQDVSIRIGDTVSFTAIVTNDGIQSERKATNAIVAYTPPTSVNYIRNRFTIGKVGRNIKVSKNIQLINAYIHTFTYEQGIVSSTSATNPSYPYLVSENSINIPGNTSLPQGTYTVFGRIEYPSKVSIGTTTTKFTEWNSFDPVTLDALPTPTYSKILDISDIIMSTSVVGATFAQFSASKLNALIEPNTTVIEYTMISFYIGTLLQGSLRVEYQNSQTDPVPLNVSIEYGEGVGKLPLTGDVTVKVQTFATNVIGEVVESNGEVTTLQSPLRLYPTEATEYTWASLTNPTFTKTGNDTVSSTFDWTPPAFDKNRTFSSYTDTLFMDQLSIHTIFNNSVKYNISTTYFDTTSTNSTVALSNPSSNELALTISYPETAINASTPLPNNVTLVTKTTLPITPVSSVTTIKFSAKVNGDSKYIGVYTSGYSITYYKVTSNLQTFTYYFTVRDNTPVKLHYQLGPMTSTGTPITATTSIPMEVLTLSNIMIQDVSSDSQCTISNTVSSNINAPSLGNELRGNELQLTSLFNQLQLPTNFTNTNSTTTLVNNPYTEGNSSTDVLRFDAGTTGTSSILFTLPPFNFYNITKKVGLNVYAPSGKVVTMILSGQGLPDQSVTTTTVATKWNVLYFDFTGFTGMEGEYTNIELRFEVNATYYFDTNILRDIPTIDNPSIVSKPFIMYDDLSYQVTFMAKSSTTRNIYWYIKDTATNTVAEGTNSLNTITLTPIYKTFTVTVIKRGTSTCAIEFTLGPRSPTLTTCFRNISVYESPLLVTTTINGTLTTTTIPNIDIGSPFRAQRKLNMLVYGIEYGPITLPESPPFIAVFDPFATVSDKIYVYNLGSPLREVILGDSTSQDNVQDISSKLILSSNAYSPIGIYKHESSFTTFYVPRFGRIPIVLTYSATVADLLVVSTDYSRYAILNEVRQRYIPYTIKSTSSPSNDRPYFTFRSKNTTTDLAMIGKFYLTQLWVSLYWLIKAGASNGFILNFSTSGAANMFFTEMNDSSVTVNVTNNKQVLISPTTTISTAISMYLSNASTSTMGLPITSSILLTSSELLATRPIFPDLSNTTYTAEISWHTLEGVGGYIIANINKLSTNSLLNLSDYLVTDKNITYEAGTPTPFRVES